MTVGMAGGSEDGQKRFPTNTEAKQDPIVERLILTDAIFLVAPSAVHVHAVVHVFPCFPSIMCQTSVVSQLPHFDLAANSVDQSTAFS